MMAIIWLLLAWTAGFLVFRHLTGDAGGFLDSLAGPRAATALRGTCWPSLLLGLSAGLWIGLLPLTWLTYGLAAVLSPLLPLSVHPLTVVNAAVMASGAAWLCWLGVKSAVRRRQAGLRWIGFFDKAAFRPFTKPAGWFFLAATVFWIVFGVFLMATTFHRDGTLVKAGYSVFSDFAPHTALVSSFSKGRNWPTEYPHYPNDGIAYHFMFYFLCGNLNFLGLPLDLAINLPSVLGLVTFSLLLGLLALRLTGRGSTFVLAPALLFFRSSWAFFTNLAKIAAQSDQVFSGGEPQPVLSRIFRGILSQSVYIGNTPNDSWGLWGVNVYANQRHLLPGLSIALIILILFLPDLQDGLSRRPPFRELLIGRDFWRLDWNRSGRRLMLVLMLGLLLPYFHGSVTVSLVLVLFLIAIFSSNRLSFVLFCAAACLSAILQSKLFAGSVAHVVQPAIRFGFIAEDTTLPGILLYLLEMSGLLLPLLAIAFWLPGRRRKILVGAFCLPLVLAFTVSLTPDVTVNHKYIMITFALSNIYIADLLAVLAGRRRNSSGTPSQELSGQGGKAAGTAALAVRRLAAVFLAVLLTVTGLQEVIILKNINRNTVAIDTSSPLVTWICSNTDPDAVFVTAPYHYNTFYLSGRATWLGHSYYAWSAGHDTSARLLLEQWLMTGCDGNLSDTVSLIDDNHLDYLLIDDTFREHPEFSVDETFFDDNFPVVVEFPDLGRIKIYDLRMSG